MTDREKEIFDMIKKNPLISQKEIANKLNIKRSSVAGHISSIIKKGFLKGKGYIINNQNYVVVIGGSNIDLQGFSNNKIIFKDSNPGKLKISLGGVARNIAENLARLNIDTKLLTVVGDDLYGEKIISESRYAGIDMEHILISKNMNTSTYLSIQNSDGDMELAISDMDITSEITIEYIQKNKDLILNSKAIIIDTNLKQDVIDYIFENFSKKDIFVDTVSTAKAIKIKKHLSDIFTIKPNITEAEKLLDITKKVTGEVIVSKFLEKGVNQIIVSNGEYELVFGNKNKIKIYNVKKVDMVNANGAGDSFIAGLVYSYLKGFSIEDTIKFSSEISKLTVESVDTVSKLISEKKIIGRIKGEINV